VGGIFLDLQKLFDSIDHSILLDKLYLAGIHGTALNLYNSYLTMIMQFVQVNGFKSTLKPVSMYHRDLGPLLYIIFINDINDLNLTGQLNL
jgi:hypothetical protein